MEVSSRQWAEGGWIRIKMKIRERRKAESGKRKAEFGKRRAETKKLPTANG